MRSPLAGLALVLALVTGCSHAAPPPPPPAPPAPAPSALAPLPALDLAGPFAVPPPAHAPVPLSITRIVSEQRHEMGDVKILAAPVGDARGRARAAAEVTALADELQGIESALRAGGTAIDSAQLDGVVDRLLVLQTRLALLHDALRLASGPTSAVQAD